MTTASSPSKCTRLASAGSWIGHVRPDDRGVGLHEDHRIRKAAAAHFLDVRGVVLADAHHLAGQDRREQPDVGQRPLPAGEVRRAKGMLGDLPGEGMVRVARLAFDADEGDPVGAGDSTKAHYPSLVTGLLADTASMGR